ncbi:hypothetical protein ACQPW3_20780 [Actinosynnema sp. CA-248983]
MRRGAMVTTIGVVGSVLAVLGFLGVETYRDLDKSPGKTTTAKVVRTTPTHDPERDKWDYIHLADKACRAATARIGEIDPYTNSSGLFPQWAAKVGELRVDLLQRWRQTSGSIVDGPFADQTRKIWADYGHANWYWTEMSKLAASGNYDGARERFETYKKYDDSALLRANELGYSSCNYAWPRPTSW